MRIDISWTVISRGAVVKGRSSDVDEEIVTNVISRFSYGVVYNEPFNPAIHAREDRFVCPYENRPKARNQMRWYLRRVGQPIRTILKMIFLIKAHTDGIATPQGENVKKTVPVKYQWRKYIDTEWDLVKNEKLIYASAAREPPARLNDGKGLLRWSSVATFELLTGV